MKQMIEAVRKHHAMNKVQKLYQLGLSEKTVKGFENISFQTWVEIRGIYIMISYGQPFPAMSNDARTVFSNVGLL
ncbi:hypothetical protein DW974_08200 [Lachnospiraceae bacterium AM48-27BH]|nr:hypothetical protein DW974_08200 [Lachnospiraceae bacterium AM48-27BH]